MNVELSVAAAFGIGGIAGWIAHAIRARGNVSTAAFDRLWIRTVNAERKAILATARCEDLQKAIDAQLAGDKAPERK